MNRADTLSPSQVARATGVSPDTLRHYERRGLLPKPVRTSAGYRRYPQSTVDRVELIQRALVIGFSLEELGQVLAERDRGGAPCRKVLGLVKHRLAALEQRLSELTTLKSELAALVADWERQLASTPAGKPARLLEGLGSRKVVEDGRRRRQGGGLLRFQRNEGRPCSRRATSTVADSMNALSVDKVLDTAFSME